MTRPDPKTRLNRVRALRRNQTEPEKRLWAKLRNRQLGGIKFRRQVWLDCWIADFAALELGLVIEIDGDTHAHSSIADARRTAYLAVKGYHVIRFANVDVMTNIDGVLEEIMAVARNCPSPSQACGSGPSLSLGERGA
ncbi:DNA methylase [Sphingobium herbicidovorans NBRC 16415]|uniref:DNA methylase n=1 Tax=Sphingobium herbicidovorans (strain ATCC 700291 / DSM 11019 / CCUG 56400 / KCTC 2939 / LMG 18315 / NBRC 16415 / MH) TaxID=1219045 RepID=A0A086PD62_SPHHM|nr:endonuclease domain-containing protein [Sphingobium herbicidovorans]KFG91330.1 DNA methylase [Sphingobium herbicidovorans NBRC 16415]